jgi:hypothetical protein
MFLMNPLCLIFCYSALVGCGWPRNLSLQAVRLVLALYSSSSKSSLALSVLGVQLIALVFLSRATSMSTSDGCNHYQSLYNHICLSAAEKSPFCDTNAPAAPCREIWSEEMESLQAIFDHQFHLSHLNIDPSLPSLCDCDVAVLDMQSRCSPLPGILAQLEMPEGAAADDDISLHVSA